jgi:uncharacterized protein YdhG (YjbR/CyaY superfamily)
MKPDRTVARDVAEYIAGFPPEVQAVLKQIRSTIRAAAPEAQEAIKYQIPTYTLKGNLVSFAAYKNHIGLYPVPAGTKKFQKELAIYRAAKSTAKFPLDQPIPFDLIRQLVKFRVKESSGRSSAKGATR